MIMGKSGAMTASREAVIDQERNVAALCPGRPRSRRGSPWLWRCCPPIGAPLLPNALRLPGTERTWPYKTGGPLAGLRGTGCTARAFVVAEVYQ